MKRRVFLILCLLLMVTSTHASCADDADTKSEKVPIGVVTYVDGAKILVGVGTTEPLATLDVSRGEIKVGSTGAACTKGLGGTLRYAESQLQLCDGAGWRNVSLDKAE